jgi:hypothetical protein
MSMFLITARVTMALWILKTAMGNPFMLLLFQEGVHLV